MDLSSSPRRSIDLNADLGEGCPWDALLLDRVSSASVCCGFHAGDPETIERTLREARRRGVIVGAHPGYPDREGFGRREQPIATEEVQRLILEQVEALAALATTCDVSIQFLKPHGALYNQAQRGSDIALGVVRAAKELGLPVLGQSGGQVETLASEAGVRFVAEGFADRRYRTDGRLVPRTEPGAVLKDPKEIEAQILRLVDSGIETLCLHGDNPHSVALADLVLDVLKTAHIEKRPFLVD